MRGGARWIAAGVAVAAIGAGVVVWQTGSDSGDADRVARATTTTTARRQPTTTTTTEAPTTSTSTSTTLASTATTTAGAPTLRRGSKGDAVMEVQRALKAMHYDPGPADGAYGGATVYAVEAFQGLHHITQSGQWGPSERAILARGTDAAAPEALVPYGGSNRVEVDLRSQTLKLYRGGNLELISHVSTGSGREYCVDGECGNKAITPVGSFRFSWRRSGWWESRLGKLYNPVYFTSSGVAVHGALSVPTYPASHGCVRIPMHIAEYFPSLVKRGDAVYVLDGKHKVGPAGPTQTGPPPTATPSGPSDTTTTTTPPTTSTTIVPATTTTTTTVPPTTTTSTTIL